MGRDRYAGWLRLRRDRSLGYQALPGREPIVQEFHVARRHAGFFAFVIEGVRGSGKAQLITHLRATYHGQGRTRKGMRVDAHLDFRAENGCTDEEIALAMVRSQLQARQPLWRRLGRPLFTLRFALMQAQVWAHERKRGAAPGPANPWLRMTVWAGRAVLGLPRDQLPPLPPRAASTQVVRQALTVLGIVKPAKWVKHRLRALEAEHVVGDRATYRRIELRRQLIAALAEDLAVATRRRIRPIEKVVLFFEGYESLERRAGALSSPWLLDLADDLRAANANVLLVVSCREQKAWSQRAPNRTIPGHRYGDGIDLHTLGPLDEAAVARALRHAGVPNEDTAELARIPRGYPLAASVLGWHYGANHRRGATADSTVRAALSQLPEGLGDQEWMTEFLRVMARSIDEGLDESVKHHARAAAALRSFDAELLEAVMVDGFRDDALHALLDTPVVEPARGSLLFDGRDGHAVRPFVREFWQSGGPQPTSHARWHARARSYFARKARSSTDEPTVFALKLEELYYAHSGDPEAAKERFREEFGREEQARRFERCRMLVEMARTWPADADAWLAELEAMDGALCRHLGHHDEAVIAFRKAQALARDRGGCAHLTLRTALGLAACLRLAGKYNEASDAIACVRRHAAAGSVASFQAAWTASLIAADRGDMNTAIEEANAATRALRTILGSPERYAGEARKLGLSALERKRGHLARHRAEIHRRAGDYGRCDEMIAEARAVYARTPEPEAEALLHAADAHLRRVEGQYASAVQLADEASKKLRSCAHPTLRAQLTVLRCEVQARLAGPAPETAQEPLEALASVDARRHPMSAAIFRYGAGELARLQGRMEEARSMLALDETNAGGSTERFYPCLVGVELEREAREHDRARGLWEVLQHSDAIANHPLLRFWTCLVGARAHAAASPAARKVRARELLDDAADALERLGTSGNPAMKCALARTQADLETASFSPMHLLLP